MNIILASDFMRIRNFQPSDLPRLFEIDQVCFPAGIAYSLEELSGFIAHRSSRTWVAEENDRIVGFVVASHEPARIGHIVTIDIVKGSRRKCVGTQLMDIAESWARKERLQLIYLETAENNMGAQAFYEVLGYRKMDKVDRYYSDGQSAWVMAKELK